MGEKSRTSNTKLVTTTGDERKKFQHIIIMNGKKFFVAEFFRRYELQPFEVDLDTLDDDSDFISHLMNQLEIHQWIEEFPLYYAVPADPKMPKSEKEKIRGIILDGRHRSWAWQLRWEKDIYVPEPKLKPRPVKSVDHAMILRAVFELQHRSKSGTVVKRHAEKIIRDQLEKHYSMFKGDIRKAIDYFKTHEFTDEAMVTRIFKKVVLKRENRTPVKSPRAPGSDSYFGQFGGKVGTGRKSQTENDLPAHDNGTSFDIRCPECKQPLICPSCMKPCYLFQTDEGNMMIKHVEVANN